MNREVIAILMMMLRSRIRLAFKSLKCQGLLLHLILEVFEDILILLKYGLPLLKFEEVFVFSLESDEFLHLLFGKVNPKKRLFAHFQVLVSMKTGW
jgi:hypothetical protein